ncbi:hypothetical protein AB0M02_22540 [Actinoplanes sp. NPDC051861]|uniref:hypothetical protein n=1 Tax=Actinoplanes sp. NPDC051861 TaxID=3155170 RepID=UPI00341FE2F5
MRWLRMGQARRQVQQDSGQQHAMLSDLRQRFGAHVRVPFGDQAGSVAQELASDDGLAVAAAILREVADTAWTEMYAQATALRVPADRMNYRPLWQHSGTHLRWPLFGLGFHPYVHVTAAAHVIGAQGRQTVRVTDPDPLLDHLFEILDLTLDGWEFGRVRVDADAATLASRLITAAREVRAAMSNPPPLPGPVREWMRRNQSVHVLDPSGTQVVGGWNPGREMRESLLA